ncbi:MAG: hypothetical protein WA667_13735 [Candidatus Nitrosopolaris sp.]
MTDLAPKDANNDSMTHAHSRIGYTFYPSGTMNVEVRCSNHPFGLHTAEDRSHLLIFFGQLRERLISILRESKQIAVRFGKHF